MKLQDFVTQISGLAKENGTFRGGGAANKKERGKQKEPQDAVTKKRRACAGAASLE